MWPRLGTPELVITFPQPDDCPHQHDPPHRSLSDRPDFVLRDATKAGPTWHHRHRFGRCDFQ